jgi:hypothetical protein
LHESEAFICKEALLNLKRSDASSRIAGHLRLIANISLEAISKKGFWFKIEAAARFKPEEYFRISRI